MYSSDNAPRFSRKTSKEIRRRQKRRREKDIRTWIRNRTSWMDYGKEIVDKKGKRHPIHCNKNIDVLRFYWQLQAGNFDYLKKIRNIDFDHHFDFSETFYYAGSHGGKYDFTLVNIDIDCKKFGSLKGAMEFAEFLKQHVFPDLYYEVSTNGNGVHGYIVVEKLDYGAEFINRLLLDRLQPLLRQVLNENDFDVENVEIKGLSPSFRWSEDKYGLQEYTAGVLAKIPRLGSPEHEKALKKTTHISVVDLLRLPLPDRSSSQSANNGGSLSLSSTGVPISEEDLDDFYLFHDVAKELLGGEILRTTGKHIVNAVDVAIFLMLGKCFTDNMNKDGTMPRNRFESVHKRLSGNNFVERAFCGKRFKVIRDLLTSLGLIDWKDNKFRVSTKFDENGRGKNGVASKWKFSEQLMEMLSFDKGKRESILSGTAINPMKISVSDIIEILKQEAEMDEITVPVQIFDDFDYQAASRLVDDVITGWPPPRLAA